MKGAKLVMAIPKKRKTSNHLFFSKVITDKKSFLARNNPVKPIAITPTSNVIPKGEKKATTLATVVILTIPAVKITQRLVKVKPKKREVNFPQPKSSGSRTSRLNSK